MIPADSPVFREKATPVARPSRSWWPLKDAALRFTDSRSRAAVVHSRATRAYLSVPWETRSGIDLNSESRFRNTFTVASSLRVAAPLWPRVRPWCSSTSSRQSRPW